MVCCRIVVVVFSGVQTFDFKAWKVEIDFTDNFGFPRREHLKELRWCRIEEITSISGVYREFNLRRDRVRKRLNGFFDSRSDPAHIEFETMRYPVRLIAVEHCTDWDASFSHLGRLVRKPFRQPGLAGLLPLPLGKSTPQSYIVV